MTDTTRVIRVHIAGYNTFILETTLGEVSAVSLEDAKALLGMPEADAAAKLKRMGATFVDLTHERTVVRVRRGYRPRDTSVPFRPRGKKAEDLDGPSPYRKRRSAPREPEGSKPVPYHESETMQSLKNYQGRPIEDVDIPF